jgi:hypothetical protein
VRRSVTTGGASGLRSTRWVDPVGFASLPDGRVAVEVDQTVRDRDGALLGEGRVRHVYAFRDGLVVSMDVEEPAAG